MTDIHHNKVTSDSVERCAEIIKVNLEKFYEQEQEQTLYEGGVTDLQRLRFVIDQALYVECFPDN